MPPALTLDCPRTSPAARTHWVTSAASRVTAAALATWATLHRAWVHLRQRQRARAIDRALRELDDHMLRDLGFERWEITSVAAEVTADVEYGLGRAERSHQGVYP